MNSILFTAVPVKDNADKLNVLVRHIITQKLISIIRQIGEQLNISFDFELNNFRKVKEGWVNPCVFHYYFKLKEAIELGDLNKILDTISLLSHENLIVSRKNSELPDITSVVNFLWEKELFDESARKDVVSEFGMENKFEVIQPVFHKDMSVQKSSVKSAIQLLNLTDVEHSYSAISPLHAIKIFNGTVRGFSYQAAYGNIYIRVPQEGDDPVPYYLEHIVHECAHQHLFALQLIDPVILNKKSDLYDAPIRLQKRPMDGIFHACFVLSRMVRCFRKTGEHFDREVNAKFIKRIEGWFNKSYETVKEHAKLTDHGKRLFGTFKECAYE